jgi:hypothetical protein
VPAATVAADRSVGRDMAAGRTTPRGRGRSSPSCVCASLAPLEQVACLLTRHCGVAVEDEWQARALSPRRARLAHPRIPRRASGRSNDPRRCRAHRAHGHPSGAKTELDPRKRYPTSAGASDRGCCVDTPIVDGHEDPHHPHRERKPSSSKRTSRTHLLWPRPTIASSRRRAQCGHTISLTLPPHGRIVPDEGLGKGFGTEHDLTGTVPGH